MSGLGAPSGLKPASVRFLPVGGEPSPSWAGPLCGCKDHLTWDNAGPFPSQTVPGRSSCLFTLVSPSKGSGPQLPEEPERESWLPSSF